jgi:hypothetical protein
MNESGKCLRCGGRDGETDGGRPVQPVILRPGSRFCYRCECDLRRESEARRIVREWESDTVAILKAEGGSK